jgi:serine/threonine-protein kinase
VLDLQLGNKLGAGSFGEVFEAIDALNRRVAVKRLKRLSADETVEQWTERKNTIIAEGQRLVDASHPHVVTVYYAGQLPADDTVVLVMELCEGGSVEALYRTGPLSMSRVRQIGMETALGLGVMHARGLLHRDIKPANILLAQNGGAKLGDFGLVTNSLLFGYGSRGSRGYADHVAYETYDTNTTSERTDIWALGMTLYRLLHGAWWYGSVPEPATYVRMGNFRDSLQWLPHIPRAWRTFIRKCLHDDPGCRCQNMAEVQTMLGRLPTTPAWHCITERDRVAWTARRNDRLIEVEWRFSEVNARRRTLGWSAISKPVAAAGRPKKLGGSARQDDLDAFFARCG